MQRANEGMPSLLVDKVLITTGFCGEMPPEALADACVANTGKPVLPASPPAEAFGSNYAAVAGIPSVNPARGRSLFLKTGAGADLPCARHQNHRQLPYCH